MSAVRVGGVLLAALSISAPALAGDLDEEKTRLARQLVTSIVDSVDQVYLWRADVVPKTEFDLSRQQAALAKLGAHAVGPVMVLLDAGVPSTDAIRKQAHDHIDSGADPAVATVAKRTLELHSIDLTRRLRDSASDTLGLIGPAGKEARPELRKRFDAIVKAKKVDAHIGSALLDVGETDKRVLRRLLVWMRLRKVDDRYRALLAAAVVRRGLRDKKQATKLLTEALRQSPDLVRDAAIDALVHHGTAALTPLSPVTEARAARAASAARVAAKRIAPAALKQLASAQADARESLVEAMSSVADAILDPVLAALADSGRKQHAYRHDLARIIGRAEAKEAEQPVLRLLRDQSSVVRAGAVRGLGSRKKLSEKACRAVCSVVANDDAPANRIEAARVLGAQRRYAEIVAGPLAQAARSEVPEVALQAVESLGALGPAAASALPTLQKLRKSATGEFATALDQAMRRIQR
ncbi:MAG: HEAT repeat domain-containing protein [Planctomycetota bacterium]|nr:HEAT repeat domain-containing protein [Planctomycetota bacterium]